MKKFIFGVVLGSILTSGAAFAAVQADVTNLKFYFSGQEKTLANGEPVIIEGRTYIPLRDVSGWFNKPVYWNEETRSVSIEQPLVTIVDQKGNEIGTALLAQETDGVKVSLDVNGLTPGKHGFHIHAQSFKGADFKAAGGHFNPENKKHGHHTTEGHLGDLGNVEVAADGTVKTDILVKGATLEKDKTNTILGKSLIIHAGEDDLKTDPAGNAGDRIAGGNIPQ